MPIGFLPDGKVVFSIEPSGRGGGWVYTGEYSNLYQTTTDSAEKRGGDRLFSCPTNTPFCVGDLTDDLSHFVNVDSTKQTIYIVNLDTRSEVWRTTITDHTFIGQPQFNADGDLAFVAVDVIEDGNALRPENGSIRVIDFPYDGDVDLISAELATNVITWIDDTHILYYELTSNNNGKWRYPIIDREGAEVRTWTSKGRFPTIIR